jgi:hypothetical protein
LENQPATFDKSTSYNPFEKILFSNSPFQPFTPPIY